MRNKCRHILYFILVLIALPSCENFYDNNGDLGGMWQLTEWRTISSSGIVDSLVANNVYNDTTVPNPRKIYYSIHRDIMQFQDATHDQRYYYFSDFRHTSDSLIIGTVVNRYDSLCHYADLKEFGVPADGCFHIQLLTSRSLILDTPTDKLTFKKY